jgi:hypothetical protein
MLEKYTRSCWKAFNHSTLIYLLRVNSDRLIVPEPQEFQSAMAASRAVCRKRSSAAAETWAGLQQETSAGGGSCRPGGRENRAQLSSGPAEEGSLVSLRRARLSEAGLSGRERWRPRRVRPLSQQGTARRSGTQV